MADRPKSPIFINSVLRPGKTHPILVAEAVDVGAQRQIRHHKKSRRGCVGCKLRKVKVDPPPLGKSRSLQIREKSLRYGSSQLAQCDERQPCSSCLKRGIQCVPPANSGNVSRQPRLAIDLGLGATPQMSLLQLELFNHWDKHTRSTLVYPEIWPVIMQHAFHVRQPQAKTVAKD